MPSRQINDFSQKGNTEKIKIVSRPDDSQDHWWEVRNKLGEVGFIPSNYVKEMDSLGLQNFDW